MRLSIDPSAAVLMLLAVALAIVAYVKVQRIITWEAPLMRWHFVGVRVLSSFAFPVLAGWLTSVFRND